MEEVIGQIKNTQLNTKGYPRPPRPLINLFMISDEIPSALSRRRSLTVSQIWRTILSVTGIYGLEGLVSVRYRSGSTVDLWSATNMNPKKKIIKFKKEIGIIADEKMVSEEYVKEAFVDLQDWSTCSLGCPLLPVPRTTWT